MTDAGLMWNFFGKIGANTRDSQNSTLGKPRFPSLASDDAWPADREGVEADLLSVSLHFSFRPRVGEHRVSLELPLERRSPQRLSGDARSSH
jgi:hypothetical protein